MISAAKKIKNGFNWPLLFLLATPYLAISANKEGFLALLPFVRDEFAISRAQSGLYLSFFFLSATLVAIFSGRLVDRLGTKRGMLLGVLSSGGCMLLHTIAPAFSVILLLSFITGLGFSFITPSVNKGVMEVSSPQNRAVSMGIMQAGGGLGGILGASLLPGLAELLGWRISVLFSAFVPLIVGVIIYHKYQSQEAVESTEKRGKNESGTTSFKADVLKLIKNRKLLSVCLLGTAFGVKSGATRAHYTIFLSQDLAISRSLAGVGFGILLTGALLGYPGWGWISDRFLGGNRRNGLLIISATATLSLLCFGLYVNSPRRPFILVALLSLLLGFSVVGTAGLQFTTVAELARAERMGMATGLALIFFRLGLMLGPLLFGLVADLRNAYDYSWMLMGLMMALSAFIFYQVSNPELK